MKKSIHIMWFVSMIAVIGILGYQSYWLYSVFQIKKSEVTAEVNKALKTAATKEVAAMVQKYALNNQNSLGFSFDPPTKTIIVNKNGKKLSVKYNNQDEMFTLIPLLTYDMIADNMLLDLKIVDATFTKILKEKNIFATHSLELVDAKTLKPKRSSNNAVFSRFITSDPAPLGYLGIDAIVAHMDFPFKAFFERMAIMITCSLTLFIIFFSCMFIQVKTIIFQQTVAKTREEFVYNMIHELKAPIAYIKNSLFLMSTLDPRILIEKQDELFVMSDKRLGLLSSLIEKLLTVSMDRTGIRTALTEIDLQATIETLLEQYRLNRGDLKEIVFETENRLSSNKIMADRVHYPNAISNLIDNAIKYSGKKAEVTIICKDDEKHVYLIVKDKGIGIPDEFHSQIFEKYFRVPQKQRNKASGFGLGLCYVKQVIDAHDGKITFKSKVKGGSEFCISIPKTTT